MMILLYLYRFTASCLFTAASVLASPLAAVPLYLTLTAVMLWCALGALEAWFRSLAS